jgi:hypothetical protein
MESMRTPLGGKIEILMDSMDSLWSPWIPYEFPCSFHGVYWGPHGVHGFHMDSMWIGICSIVSRIDDILWIPPELVSVYWADLSAQYILLEMQHHFRLKRGLTATIPSVW